MRRTCWALVVTVVACTMLICTPVSAQDQSNHFRFGTGWYTTVGDGSDVADNAIALWASYERRYSEKLGFEVLGAYADYDPILDLFGRDIEMTPLLLSLNYYVKSTDKVELYIAPTVGLARLEVHFAGETESDSGLAWGAVFGVDIPLGQGKWGIALSGRYLTADLDDADFDNIAIHAGAGYRF
jgi:hypothetical protein